MEVKLGGGEITVIGILLGSVVTALVAVFKLLMSARDSQLADRTAERDNYRSVAADAVRMMEAAVTKQRAAEGLPPIKPLAAVLPEHQSPVSEAEETTAHQATLRAAVTAAGLELGVPSRSDPPTSAGQPSEQPTLVSKVDAIAAVLALPPVEPAAPDPHETSVPNAREGMTPRDFVDQRLDEFALQKQERLRKEEPPKPSP